MSEAAPGPRLWVVCPMLRDTESYLRLHDEVLDVCRRHGWSDAVRFVVVDDSAGTDHEVAQLTRFPDVTVLTPPFGLGHQRAIVYGLRYMTPEIGPDDVVVTMDSDGEDQPSDLPRLVEELRIERRSARARPANEAFGARSASAPCTCASDSCFACSPVAPSAPGTLPPSEEPRSWRRSTTRASTSATRPPCSP